MGPDDVLGGKYRLTRLLGRGSMGAVWSASHATLGEQVAVKLLTRAPECEGMEDATAAAARFRFEAQIAARLSRKTRHIVRVTDHGEADGVAYLVMELLEGKTLASHLLFRGRLSPREVEPIVAQAARALEVAHADGVVHRDLKPANIFLTRDEDGWVLVKLLDFGIARAIHTRRVVPAFATGAGFAAGTPGYMSPEQARGGSPNARFDLWALATVAYEALTGELPMPGSSAGELFASAVAGRVSLRREAEALPGGLLAFFERAFHTRPESRYETASELAAAFERAVDGLVRPVGIGEDPTRRAGPSHPKSAESGPERERGSPPGVPQETPRTAALTKGSHLPARAWGMGTVLAAALLVAAATAVVGLLNHGSPPLHATSARPAVSSTAAEIASVSQADPVAVRLPPLPDVEASAPAEARTSSGGVDAREPPGVRPKAASTSRSKAPTAATTGMPPVPQRTAAPLTAVDKSATF
jgi:serine/threonine-protein kinase